MGARRATLGNERKEIPTKGSPTWTTMISNRSLQSTETNGSSSKVPVTYTSVPCPHSPAARPLQIGAGSHWL
jgi:hypothetical protein